MKTISLKNRAGSDTAWKKTPVSRKVLLIGLALVVVAASGYTAYRAYARSKAAAAAAAAPQLQTAVARTGDLTITASGTGTLVAASELSLSFDDSGTLSEVLVKPGDQVKAGQVLARLKTNNTETSLAADVAAAQLAVLNAQKSLDSITTSAQMNTAKALKAVEDAQAALDSLQNPASTIAAAQQAVAVAQSSLSEAQAAYNRTHSTASQANIDDAYARLLIAKKNYENIQADFDKNFANKPVENIERAQAQTRLSSAKAAYTSAQANYNAMISTSGTLEQSVAEANLAAAKAKLADAQRLYDQVKDGPTPGELAVAQATLADAQAEYTRLKDGADPNDIAIAQATLDDAKAKLELAQQKKVIEELAAPYDGTILSVDATVGANVNGGVITIANVSQPMVQIYLDETDMGNVKVGYRASVTFDALPDQTFTGKVVEVNPSLVRVSNVSTMQALVELDQTSSDANLPIGLNGSVDVISGEATNAVLVPMEALRDLGGGQYAVFVMENGAPKMKVITVGLKDLTTAQILTGVKAGDVVTTGTTETTSGTSGATNTTSGEQNSTGTQGQPVIIQGEGVPPPELGGQPPAP